MCGRVALVGAAFAASSLVTGCLDEPPGAPEGGLMIEVAPLTLEGLTDVAYDLRVVNADSQTVWTRAGVRASAFGDGTSLSYVGPCDADPDVQPNAVELTVAALYDADGALDAGAWVDPTADGPLSVDVLCEPDADVAVAFDVAVMRRAQQGFFDVAVEFDDIFCSAKFDCARDGGAPLELVHGPGGARLPSAVLALACTSGPGSDTWLYLDDLVIDCGGQTATIDVSAGPGNLYTFDPDTAPAPLVQAQIFRGLEQLSGAGGGYAKRYVNAALAVDFAAVDGPCSLTTAATAHDGALVDGATPTGAYPVIRYEIPLVNAAGDGYGCGQMALDHPAGVPGARVASAYVTTPPGETFDVAFGADASGLFGQRTATCDGVDPVEYTTPGTYTYTVESGCTDVRVDVVGGGGGGSSYAAYNARSGAGGAAGGYVSWSLAAGDVLNITVGAGGTTNNAGGDSIVASPAGTIVAGGGGPGQTAQTAAGGAGGVLSGDFDGGSDGPDGAGCSCVPYGCNTSYHTHTNPPGVDAGPYAAGSGACSTGVNGGVNSPGGAGGAPGYGGDGGGTFGLPGQAYGGGGGGAAGAGSGGYVRITFE